MTSRTAAVFGFFVAITAASPFGPGDRYVHAASWGLWNDPHGDIVKPVPRPAAEPAPVLPPKPETPKAPAVEADKLPTAASPDGSTRNTAATAVQANPSSRNIPAEPAGPSAEPSAVKETAASSPAEPATHPPVATPAAEVQETPGAVPAEALTSPAAEASPEAPKEAPLLAEVQQPTQSLSSAPMPGEAISPPAGDDTAGTAEAAPAITTEAESAAPRANIEPPATAAGYVIGPGDVLDIAVWRDESLTKTVMVLPDGTVSFPLIGEVKAAGRTVEQLKEEIGTRLSRYVSDLTLSLEVRQVNSMMIYVIGKVNSPGRHAINSAVNVLQALAMAGGLNPFAKKDDIKIFRQEEGKTVIHPFAYSEVSRGNRLEENITLRRGDLIVVP